MIVNLIEWLNNNEGASLAILTFVYTVATILILLANRKSVKEMERTREAEYRPYVVVYMDYQPNGAVQLIVKNVGRKMAYSVRISTDKDIQFPKEKPLSESRLMKEGIPNLPPGHPITFLLGVAWDLQDENKNVPSYKARVTYSDERGKTYEEDYILDINYFNGSTQLMLKGLHDLVKEVEKIRKKCIK